MSRNNAAPHKKPLDRRNSGAYIGLVLRRSIL
jgi:hypothetical protein